MSYTIVRTNGSVLTTIQDGTVNTSSTPLSLPGRNYASYGQIVDTNFIRALENFANTAPPSNAMKGQLWYNTTPSSEGLYLCPLDGEDDPNNWVRILTPNNIGNLAVTNLAVTSNITANNATITNNANANAISTNYLTVNVQANIANATITGNTLVANLRTANITTGANTNPGTLTGAWTVNGNATVNSIANTALYVAGGNLVIDAGIKTNNYYHSNGAPVSFDGTYTNSNVAAYLPTYVGNVGEANSSTIFNGRTLSTGSNSVAGTLIGNWTLSAGSALNGIPSVSGANVTGTVPSATFAISAGTATSATTAGTVTTAAQPNITSVGTLTGLNVDGNITAINITANTGVFTGNGSRLSSIAGANVTGTVANATFATTAGSATTAGTVTANAQSNITTVGTLTRLIVSGNASFTGANVSLGSNANVRITGGLAGQVLATNGSGGLSWESAAAADTAITVTANAQPNITSTGTLTELNVSGDASFTGPTVNLGTDANLKISGGTSGQILTSLGAGDVAWQSAQRGDIPSGTRMLFIQSSAPAGWVKDTTMDNAALRIVSGAAGTGGTVNFTSAFTSQSVSGSVGSTTAGGSIGSTSIGASIGDTAVSGTVASTTAGGSISTTSISANISNVSVSGVVADATAGGTVGGTALTEGQLPSHRHLMFAEGSPTEYELNDSATTTGTVLAQSNTGGDTEYSLNYNFSGADRAATGPIGSGQAHGHTFVGSSHTHGFTSGLHTHAFEQTAHSHTFTGTSHNHSFTSPNHSHAFTDSAHSHSFTGTSHNHTFSGTAINLAVKYVDAIIATKS